MNNPYKPPASDLIDKDELNRYHPSFYWKVYFWFSMVMFTLNIILLIVSSIYKLELISYNLMDVVDFIVWSVSTIAIFGLAWSRKLFSLKFWLMFLLFFILWYVVYSLIAPFGFEMPKYGMMPKLTNLFYEVPFFFLTLWGLYRYTNSMDELWNDSIKKDEAIF